MRTAVKDRENNKTEEPQGRQRARRAGWRRRAGALPCCRLILGAAARPAPSPVAGSAPAPQCARAPAASGSGPPGAGGEVGSGERAQGKEAGGREKEREAASSTVNKTEQAKERRWLGEREEVWVRATRGPASRPSVCCTGFFKGAGRVAATLHKLAPGGGGNGHPGPFCHPQVALPRAAPREKPQPAPMPHGEPEGWFSFQAQDPAHRMDEGAKDPRFLAFRPELKGGEPNEWKV